MVLRDGGSNEKEYCCVKTASDDGLISGRLIKLCEINASNLSVYVECLEHEDRGKQVAKFNGFSLSSSLTAEQIAKQTANWLKNS